MYGSFAEAVTTAFVCAAECLTVAYATPCCGVGVYTRSEPCSKGAGQTLASRCGDNGQGGKAVCIQLAFLKATQKGA